MASMCSTSTAGERIAITLCTSGWLGGSIRHRLNRHKVKKAGLWTHFADIRVLMTLVGGKIKFTESKFAESKNLPQVEYRGKFKR